MTIEEIENNCLTPLFGVAMTPLFGTLVQPKSWFICFVAFAFPFASLQSIYADDRNDEPREHTTDSLDTVRSRVEEKKAVLVDVRDLVEWNAGHIKNAKHLPWRELQDKLKEEEVAKKISKDLIVYTHCAVGYRSLRAAKILKKYGYDVRALKPGYDDLVKAGFPSEKAE